MDDISIQESAVILRRLHHERRAIEKALLIADKLAGVEQTIQEREVYLANLNTKISEREGVLQEVDENISDLHKQREARCVERERSAQEQVDLATAQLADLRTERQGVIDMAKREILALNTEYQRLKEEYHAEEVTLSNRVKELREVLADLQRRVAPLVNR